MATGDADVRAVIAPYIPSQVVSALASEGIASFQASEKDMATLDKQKTVALPKTTSWGEATKAKVGRTNMDLRWLAIDVEQTWTHSGRCQPTVKASKAAAKK